MPSLNVSSYVRDCVESVMNQSLREIEIICVDAGSTDGTLEILEELQKKDDRIRIIHSDKKSYGYQMNLGIADAEGEYIGIVETDDYIDERMYEEMYEFAISFDADVVKAPYMEFSSDHIQQICYYADEFSKKLPHDSCFSAKEYGEVLAYHASVWSGIYKRKYLTDKQIRFVEAEKAGYVDVGFRIDTCVSTERIAWFDKAYYHYRRSSKDSSTNSFDLTVMNQRWKEAHGKLSEIKEDYDQYYAPYLIFDEYLNTLAYIGNRKITDAQLETMIGNMSCVEEESIRRSPVLTDRIRNRILSFKKDPYAYCRKRDLLYYPRSAAKTIGNAFFPQGSKFRRKIKKLLLLNRGAL